MARASATYMLAWDHAGLSSGRLPNPGSIASEIKRAGGVAALDPQHWGFVEEMLNALAGHVRAKGGMSALPAKEREGYAALEAATGRSFPVVGNPPGTAAKPPAAASTPVSTHTPSPAVRAAMAAALTSADITAIMTKANSVGLGPVGALLVVQTGTLSYAECVEILDLAANPPAAPAAAVDDATSRHHEAVASARAYAGRGKPVAHVPATHAAAPAAHAPAAPAAGGGVGGGVNLDAVHAARAFAQSRGIGRSAQR